MKIKIVFLGNHTVGVQVLKTMHELGCLSGIIAHPEDPEDGVRYLSVYEYGKQLNVPVIRATPKDPVLREFINKIKPDLIWVTDYKYLLPSSVFLFPRLGAINLHPSLLPYYKGRASLNWALIYGEKKVGLTAHFIDEGVDTGDIIKQVELPLHEDDYIGDVLDKIYPLYSQITREVIEMFREGAVLRHKQLEDGGSIYPARTEKDGLIDCTWSAQKVLNFIKALSKPYPGAFVIDGANKIIVWRAELVSIEFESLGIHRVGDDIYLQCGDGALKIKDCKMV